jgi:3-hydroxyisobutyrate dehydrogenase
MQIAFIGLGNMGTPMAANLVRAGHSVQGFDLSQAAMDAAHAVEVPIANSADNAVQGADCVITMLPAGHHVLAAVTALLGAATQDALFIDCSTIDVESAREVNRLVSGAGKRAIDAPVSGGVGGAGAGTLTFMVGGSQEDFAAAHPVLSAMGKRIVHCGEAGAGQAAKICNNMILGITMIAVSEAFVLGEKLGLSHQALFDVASAASGQCWSLTTYCPVPGPVPASPANHGYKPGFATALMLKDLKLAQQAAEHAGAATSLGQHAAKLYAAYSEAGGETQDFSGIVADVRKRSRPDQA